MQKINNRKDEFSITLNDSEDIKIKVKKKAIFKKNLNHKKKRRRRRNRILFIIFVLLFIIIISPFLFKSIRNPHLIFKYKPINNDTTNTSVPKPVSNDTTNADSSTNIISNISKFDFDFQYYNYERELITEKMKRLSAWQLSNNEPYFLNGIIRKFKPKKCLEIGVALGGSAIIILNALKDVQDSILVSLDLNTDYYADPKKKTGERVNRYFPELTKDSKWRLFTGEQPHKFLDKLNMKFDFLLLDTVHRAPGEIINIIEALPFLEENAIVVLHDIMFHLPSHHYYNPPEVKYHPCQIYLMTALNGNKIVIESKEKGSENIGAVILNSNQEQYYLNYFLLLLAPWDYMIEDNKVEELRIFIKKYYKNDKYLNVFNRAVEENKMYVNKFTKLYNNIFKYNKKL